MPTTPLKPNRILIVEDDPAVRRLLARQACAAGWEPSVAAGRTEAHHLFERGRFHALLSDVDLAEGEDGIRLALELCAIDPALRVVVMSALPANEARARWAGFGFFLHKPLEPGRFGALLSLFRASKPRGESILLVEDDAALREMLVQYIKAAGWEVVEAGNGAQALQAFQPGRFRLLVADVRLDEQMDGIDVAKRLLRLEPGLKVAMISGVPGASERVRAAGLPLFFDKPLGIAALVELFA